MAIVRRRAPASRASCSRSGSLRSSCWSCRPATRAHPLVDRRRHRAVALAVVSGGDPPPPAHAGSRRGSRRARSGDGLRADGLGSSLSMPSPVTPRATSPIGLVLVGHGALARLAVPGPRGLRCDDRRLVHRSRSDRRVADFEPLARAAMDPAAFDYIAGGAWDEQSLGGGRGGLAPPSPPAAGPRRRQPRRPVDDDGRLGRSPLPVGDRADGGPRPRPSRRRARDGRAAAAAAGIPFTLSTMSSALDRGRRGRRAGRRSAGSSSTPRPIRGAAASSSSGRRRPATARSS